MKRNILILLVGICSVLWSMPTWAATPKASATPSKTTSTASASTNSAGQAREVMQAELARLLVKLLGLDRFLSASPTDFECFVVLLENGIAPVDGWQPDVKVTRGDLARVIVEAMKRQGEIKTPDDPMAWIDFLKANGISMESVGEVTASVKPLPEPVAPSVVKGATLAMEKRHKYNPVDESHYGVDIGMVVRTVTQLELPPKPVTPD